MENVAEVMKIIEAGLEQDQAKTFNYSQLLIAKLESKGDVKTANRLRRLIKNSKAIVIKAKGFEQMLRSPVDAETRLPLAEIERFEKDSVFLTLSQSLKEDVLEYVDLINRSEEFLKGGIKFNRSLLFFGPPGTGKTQAARYVAAQTGLPLVTVRIDGLVSSYLGNTSKNIRALFEFVESTPCILFMDEFDAIAKIRDDSNELGELKRVVNTLLQNIDSIESKVPVIAATNHEHLLDPAVWRRFDYRLRINLPNREQRSFLIKEFLQEVKTGRKVIQILSAMTDNFSGADLKSFCTLISTNLFLDKKESLELKDLMGYFIKYKNRSAKKDHESVEDDKDTRVLLAREFKKKDKKTFTIRDLSEMVNVSTGKMSGVMKGGDKRAE